MAENKCQCTLHKYARSTSAIILLLRLSCVRIHLYSCIAGFRAYTSCKHSSLHPLPLLYIKHIIVYIEERLGHIQGSLCFSHSHTCMNPSSPRGTRIQKNKFCHTKFCKCRDQQNHKYACYLDL